MQYFAQQNLIYVPKTKPIQQRSNRRENCMDSSRKSQHRNRPEHKSHGSIFHVGPPGRTDKPFRTFIECSTITPLLLLHYRWIGEMNESDRPPRRAEEIEEAVNNCVSRSHGQQCRLYKRSRDSPTASTIIYRSRISTKQSLPQNSRWAVLSDIN